MDGNCIPIIGISRLRIGTDGPGVRTLIGTYGCPLKCRYCFNPQSWNGSGKPLMVTPEALYGKIAIDNIYFQATNGGLTIGGGEPLLHIQAIEELAKLCPDSWNFWAETSLQVDSSSVARASRIFDHFVVDIKSTDPEIYRAYTGGDLKQAMDNLLLLKNLVGCGHIRVRIPRIPGFADEDDQKRSAGYIASLGFEDIDLFNYRTDIPT